MERIIDEVIIRYHMDGEFKYNVDRVIEIMNHDKPGGMDPDETASAKVAACLAFRLVETGGE